ncbi:MAG: MjaI family restriction endonuclease [Desulfococcaceae bacterium]
MKPAYFPLYFVILTLAAAFSGNSHGAEKIFFIRNAEIAASLRGAAPDFPKYTGQILNLANQNAQATRPKTVGQISELIQQFPGREYEEWVRWYTAQKPEAVDQATEKIYDMIVKLRRAMEDIDKALVKKWVENLILTQSYAGLRFQKSILKQIADTKKTDFRLANPEEESKGIDGYIGDMPVSVKPVTYKSKPMLPEQIEVKIIYYEKKKHGIKVFYDF